MLEAPIYNTAGEQIDTLKIDEEVFGGEIKYDLIKQAVTIYHKNSKQGSAKTKSRSETAYTGKKLFRQKGTGSARRGSKSDPLLRGGGHTFAKTPGKSNSKMPQKMRQAALKSAILAKLLGEDLKIVDGLKIDEPKTSEMAKILKNLGINRSCLLALAENDKNIYLSSRNIPKFTVDKVVDLNAWEVVKNMKMIATVEAMEMLSGKAKSNEE